MGVTGSVGFFSIDQENWPGEEGIPERRLKLGNRLVMTIAADLWISLAGLSSCLGDAQAGDRLTCSRTGPKL